MSVQCAVCGHLLADADMACPTCLPNFYKPAERVWPTTSQSDKLLKGEGYPPAMDFTEPSDIVERVIRGLRVQPSYIKAHEAAYDLLRSQAAEIERLRTLLLAGLALHGGEAFTDSEKEWREQARAALGIGKQND